MRKKDYLSQEEREEFDKQWNGYKDRLTPETKYNVHSNMPVIGKPLQFEDRSVFRAHVFQRKLKKFDPYFLSQSYIHPFWHLQHYVMAMEQTYHASLGIIRNNYKMSARDSIKDISLKKFIFWRDRSPYIELILQEKGHRGDFDIGRAFVDFYLMGEESPRGHIDVVTFSRPRNYIQKIEEIKKGNRASIDELTSMIESQDAKLKRMIESRQNLTATKEELIYQIKNGKLPEEEIHDFFSFWDKE